MAFDHDLVIAMGLLRIKNKVEYTDIAFNLMPELFTLGELQQVYETILGKKLLDPAFRRIIADKVEKTSQIKTGGGHRPSVLYKFKEKRSERPKDLRDCRLIRKFYYKSFFDFSDAKRRMRETIQKTIVFHFILRCIRKIKRILRKLFFYYGK